MGMKNKQKQNHFIFRLLLLESRVRLWRPYKIFKWCPFNRPLTRGNLSLARTRTKELQGTKQNKTKPKPKPNLSSRVRLTWDPEFNDVRSWHSTLPTGHGFLIICGIKWWRQNAGEQLFYPNKRERKDTRGEWGDSLRLTSCLWHKPSTHVSSASNTWIPSWE